MICFHWFRISFLLHMFLLPTSFLTHKNRSSTIIDFFFLILESKMIKCSTIIRSSHLAKSRKIYCFRIRFVGRIECFFDSVWPLAHNHVPTIFVTAWLAQSWPKIFMVWSLFSTLILNYYKVMLWTSFNLLVFDYKLLLSNVMNQLLSSRKYFSDACKNTYKIESCNKHITFIK